MDQFVVTVLAASTPLIYASLGGCVALRAGIPFLGIEGLMLVGALAAVAGVQMTDSAFGGLIAAVVLDLLMALLFWVLVAKLGANAIIAGLGLTGVAIGGTAFCLQVVFGTRGQLLAPDGLPRPFPDGFFGVVAFQQLSILVWLTPVATLGVWLLTRRTHLGLRLAAAGDYPFAAQAAGVRVDRVRLYSLLIAGVLSAFAGSELALGGLAAFQENMVQGRGFLAFVAALFGAGNPLTTTAAALFFGLAQGVGLQAQLAEVPIVPAAFVSMIPYVVTIVAVWITGIRGRGSLSTTLALGELRS